MTSDEEHLRKIKEHLEEIDDAIDVGIEKRPITIGFHCSSCAVEMLELYLHKINKISAGKIVKHDWFKKPQEGQKVEPLAERMLGVDFPGRAEILSLMYKIEGKRDKLIYGKSSVADVASVAENFTELKRILSEKLKKEGVEIE